MAKDMTTLTAKIEMMERELPKLSDLSALRASVEARKQTLAHDKHRLEVSRKAYDARLATLKDEYESRIAELDATDTYVQLKSLETKWQTLEKHNHSLAEYVAREGAQTAYADVAAAVMERVAEYNAVVVAGTRK